MTPDEKIQVCLNCDNREMDIQKGVVCKLTNEKPTFDEACPDLKVSNAPKGTSYSHLNPDSEPEMGGWLKFMLLMICVGVIMTVIQNINDIANSAYGTYIVIFVILHCLSFISMGGYAIYAFIARKANAVFWGFSYLTLCLITNIILLCSNDGGNLVFEGIRAVTTCIAWMFFLYFSDNVNDLFPKEKRSVKKHDWILAIIGIIIPYIFFIFMIIAAAGIAASQSLDNSHMTETYTEEDGYYTDGITAFKIPADYKITEHEANGLTYFRVVNDSYYTDENITIASEHNKQLSQREFLQYVDAWTDAELEETSHTDEYHEKTMDGKHMHYHCIHYDTYGVYWELAVISDPDIDKNFLVSIYTQEPENTLYFFANNVKFE